MNNNRLQNRNTNRLNPEYNVGYVSNAMRIQKRNDQVISGYFPKQSAKAMAIEKVNKTLCGLLICAILISAVSYFFVVSSEIKLNECSRKTTMLNVENAELQNKLDKLKSFNNVDITMQKHNFLQRPEKVIEATDDNSNLTNSKKTQSNQRPKAWTIGY